MHNILARKSSATHYIIDLTLRASDNRPWLYNSSKACGDHLWLIKSLVTKPPFLSSGHLRPIERRVFHHWSSQVAEFDGLLYRWKCWTVTDSIHASTRAWTFYVNNDLGRINQSYMKSYMAKCITFDHKTWLHFIYLFNSKLKITANTK